MTRTIIEDLEGTTIRTMQGTAAYSHTEMGDKDGWDDHWLIANGEYAIHDGARHHVYLLNRSD